VSAFQSAWASSCRGHRGWEGSKERRLAFPANSVTCWALWGVFWVLGEVVVDAGWAGEGVEAGDDAEDVSEALLAFLPAFLFSWFDL